MSRLSTRDAGNLILALLRAVHSDHVKRGPDGKTLRAALNKFDEISFAAGYMAEEVVIARLHLFAADNGVTFRVISMDHPDQMIPASTKVPDYTVYLIGLDGLDAFAEATDGQLRFRDSRTPAYRRPQYGTRISIAAGTCPLYSDILATGVLRPTTGEIFVARRTGGVHLYGAYQIGTEQFVHTNRTWSPSGIVYCDSSRSCLQVRFVEPLRTTYKLTTVQPTSTIQSLIDLTTGGVLASCDATRNGALQLITSYLLVTEGGGIVAGMDGLDLGNEFTNHWGTDKTMSYVAAGGVETLEYILTAVPDHLLV